MLIIIELKNFYLIIDKKYFNIKITVLNKKINETKYK